MGPSVRPSLDLSRGPSTSARGPKPEGLTSPQPFGRCAVLEDHRGHRAGSLGPIQRLGNRIPGALADDQPTTRVHLKVAGPVGVGFAGRDEEGPIGLLVESDRNRDGAPARSTARLDPDDLAPLGELIADVVRAQRPRCQDLPSVTTDGA